jgi:hypothetical protein
MGKSENIKRTKRLTEARRRKESEMNTSKDDIHDEKEIKEGSKDSEKKVDENKSEVNYSLLLREFIAPIVQHGDDAGVYEKKITFGAMVWNAAILKEIDERHYLHAKAELLKMATDKSEVEEIFEYLHARKKELYPEHKDLIVNFEINNIHGKDFDLTVETNKVSFDEG